MDRNADRETVMKVLAVDDNELNLKLIATLLEARGHQACAITDPTTVLQAALDFRPDIVLLDIAMPGRDGIEVMRDLRACQSLRNLPIHALTAHDTGTIIDHVGPSGFTSVLRKPCTIDRLLSLLEETAAAKDRLANAG